MCVVEREIYVQPTGAHKIIETERPCRNATATRLCNNVDHRQIQRSYTGISTPNPARERHDDLIITEGRDGTERAYREVTGRLRRRRSKTNRHSASSSGTPISSEDSLSVSSPSRYSTVEVKPAALSPRIRSWDLPLRERTPDRRANERHRSMTREEKPSSDFPPSLKSHRPATKEGNNSPNGPEQSQQTSTPNRIPPPKNPPHIDTQRPRSSLRPQIDLKTPSPIPSPIISSPGLSNLPSLRHRRNDSAKGFISKESSRGNSSPSDRSSSRRSGAEGQRVRFEGDVYEGRNERDGGSRSWSESSAERGERFWGRGGGALGKRREDLRMQDGQAERQRKAPAAGPDGYRGSSADEGRDLIERRDRHRRRAEDALNGRVRDTREQVAGSEPREMARERPAGGFFEPEERAGQKHLESSRSSLRTAERSPISPSSTSKSSASPPATSRQIRRVTVHQYRYGENT